MKQKIITRLVAMLDPTGLLLFFIGFLGTLAPLLSPGMGRNIAIATGAGLICVKGYITRSPKDRDAGQASDVETPGLASK